jgi:hypothetical protein
LRKKTNINITQVWNGLETCARQQSLRMGL